MHALLGNVTTTRVVLGEVAPDANRAGEQAILAAVRKRQLRIVDEVHREPEFEELDAGEASILRVAVHTRRRCLILIDERAERSIARERGLAVVGTAGLLVQAKRKGLIIAVRPLLETILAKDFRMSAEFGRTLLQEVGEG